MKKIWETNNNDWELLNLKQTILYLVSDTV